MEDQVMEMKKVGEVYITPIKPMDQSRVLDDVREILSQKINAYRVGRDWGFANAGIMSDGYRTKEIAEIAARDAIIEAARAVAHVG